MLVDRAISPAVFVDNEPDQKHCLNSSGEEAKRVEWRDSVAKQFKDRRSRSQSRYAKMDRQQGAMQKPCWNYGGADQHARVSRKQSSEDRRTTNEDAGNDAQKLVEH